GEGWRAARLALSGGGLSDYGEDGNRGSRQQSTAGPEDGPHPENGCGEASHKRSERGADSYSRAEHAQRPADPGAWRPARYECRGGRDGSGGGALHQAKDEEVDRAPGKPHQADRNGASEHRAQQHGAAPVAVGQGAPDGAHDGERSPRRTTCDARPDGQVARVVDPQFAQVHGQEGKGEREPEDRCQLREPERGEVSLPARQGPQQAVVVMTGLRPLAGGIAG